MRAALEAIVAGKLEYRDQGEGPGWDAAVAWNILPAAIGNVFGGALLLAVPFRYVSRSGSR